MSINEMITQLPTVPNAQLSDVIYAVQGFVSPASPGTSVQETLQQVLTLVQTNIILSFPGNPNGNVAGALNTLCWDSTDKILYICTTAGTTVTAVWTPAGSVSIPVTLAQGGTSASLTANNGGIFYSTATAGAILAGTATARQMLQSGATAAPTWSTTTWPATSVAGNLLYSSATDVISDLTTTARAVLASTSANVPNWLALTDGQLVIGSTAGQPAAASLTAGSGITITPGSNSISIAASSGAGSPLTTKGDLYTFSSVNTRLAVGTTDGQILQVNAAATTGLAWSTASYPVTTTINQLLFSSSANVVSGITTANDGLLVTSNTGVPSILAGPGTTGNILQSNAAAAPSFSTATYPSVATSTGTILRANGTNWVPSTATFADTYSASTILYSNGANTVTGLATANSASLVTNSTGVPAWTASLTNGQIIIGSTGATPTPATLTAGTGISITNGAGSVTINGTGGGITWSTVTGTSQAAAVNNGYFANNAGLVTVTLPATAAVGSIIEVAGQGAGGWSLVANTGQTIQYGNVATTSGGSFSSTNQFDTIRVVCQVANTTWQVLSSVSTGLTQA